MTTFMPDDYVQPTADEWAAMTEANSRPTEPREALTYLQREAAVQIEDAARSLRTEHNVYNARALCDQIVVAAQRAYDACAMLAGEAT